MEPVRPIHRNDPSSSIGAVSRVGDARVRRETPEEAHERRQREQRERARRQAARAWADSQLRAVQAEHDQIVVSEEDSDDGRPHVDIRI
jgi:hypothetical protein